MSKMNFAWSLPTLRELAAVKSGQYLVMRNMDFFRSLLVHPWKDVVSYKETKNRQLFIAHFAKIIGKMNIPDTLKQAICDVVNGIYYQLLNWVKNCPDNYDVLKSLDLKLLFDSHGHLNRPKMWERHLERQANATNDLSTLRNFLQLACYQTVLPSIDLILRRILLVNEQTGATHLEGPYSRMNCGNYTMMYWFVNRRSTRMALDTFTNLTTTNWCGASFIIDRESLSVVLGAPSETLNFDAFQKHLNQVSKSTRVRFLENVVIASSFHCNTPVIVNVLNLLEDDRRRYCFSKVPYELMESFLLWPYTEFFIPILRIASQYLTVRLFYRLFDDIVRKIPSEENFGNLYNRIMREFWVIVPESVKVLIHPIVFSYSPLGGRKHSICFCGALQDLLEKDPYMCRTVIKELDALHNTQFADRIFLKQKMIASS